ncbi:hypothetical protein [Chitinilyticum litopenaei]|uniref:hypothetical protein n=1 Tax=Chitinilyticum litopenaei TaxID=1121276 RepID=UPI000684862F|nr:hypothetical protein [Chitinilyticum litopenaei]
MKTFIEYVDELKEKEGLKSDNELARLLSGKDERSSLVSGWRTGRRPEDYYCIVIAQRLGINPLEIIAAANMEREQDPARLDWWEDFSKRHGFKALPVALISMGLGLLYNNLYFLESVPKLYIM